MNLKALAATAASILTLAGLTFGGVKGYVFLEDKFEKREVARAERERIVRFAEDNDNQLAELATKEFIQQRVAIEKGDHRTRLDLIDYRLSWLLNKSSRTPDEEEQIRRLRQERDRIVKRLDELEKE